MGTADLPWSHIPERGFLASANDRPEGAGDVPLGWFFSPNDRAARMAALVGGPRAVTVADIKAVQRDVHQASSLALRDAIVAALDEHALFADASGEARTVIELLRGWDGHYRAESRGAVAFELFNDGFTAALYEWRYGADDWAAFANLAQVKTMLLDDMAKADRASLAAALSRGLDHAAARIGEFASWGDMHRLVLAHPLAMAPLIGGRFRFADRPVGGSNDTLMKTAHGAASERHQTRYGSNARHVSDMSDPDRNWFVLLGGQDGWFNSAAFLDQIPLWLEGGYVEMPLRIETVRRRFARTTELVPGAAP